MATTYTITRPNAASYDFTINLDAAFAVATTIRWEIHPTQGEFPLALTTPWTGTVAFDTSQTNQLVTAAITRNHKFLRDFEIRLYDVADNANTPLFTSDAQSIAGDSTLPDRSRSLSGGSDQNVIGLGLSDHISSASGGAGDDTFLITRFQYGTVEIRDGSTSEGGKNLVKFDYEVTITGYHEISSDFFGDMAIDSAALTLSTGAVVTIQSPVGSFRYQLGNGAVRTYDEFKSDVGASGTADTFAGTDTNRFTGDYTITAFTDAPTLSGTRREAGVERSLSGASNEDIFTATSDYDLILSGGAGDDVFVISRFQYGTVEIRDGSTSEGGKNLVKFDYEVTITGYHEISSDFFGDMAIDSAALTLSTGAVVTIQSPVGSFRYQLGNGAVRTYDEFKSDVGASGTADTFAGTDTNAFGDAYSVPEPKTSESALFDVTGDTLSRTIDEDVGDVPLFTFKAVLASDANADVGYDIIAGDTGGVFEVVKDGDGNAVISLAENKKLDLEDDSIPNFYRLTVQLSASGVEPETVRVTINVRDVNDEAPVFSPSIYTAEIAENLGVDGDVVRVQATDADDSAAYSIVRYDIISGNIGDVFKIDEITGQIRVAKALDFDTAPKSYTLRVSASDGVSGTADVTATVSITLTDVNDIVPTYTPSGTPSIRATATGHATATKTGYSITIDDADTGNDFTFGLSDSTRFEFVRQQNTDVWDLVLKAGQIVNASPSPIRLTYHVDDGAHRAAQTGSVSVAVVETTVSFAPGKGSQSVNIDENDVAPANLPTLEATSSESGGSIAYTITGGNSADKFTIGETSGIITLKSGALDYESDARQYTLKITATHTPSNKAHTATVIVNVDDVNEYVPAFAQPTYTAEIAENLAVDADVVRVRATDADGSDAYSAVRYSIVSGNTGDVFRIDEATGQISVAKALDFDTAPKSYTLRVSATDDVSGTIPTTATVSITLTDVNDIVPTYTTSGTPSIRSTDTGHSTATSTGYSITITDADTGNDFTFGLSDSTRFEFVETTPGSGVWELFLKANQVVTASPSTIALTYRVYDGVNYAAEDGSIDVAVVETTVRFTEGKGSQTVNIDENNAFPSTIATLEATSSESGGAIRYDINSIRARDGGPNIFSIGDDGTISIDQALDYELDETQYTLTITATHTTSGKERTATVVVNLDDVNEHSPIFSSPTYAKTIVENLAVDGEVIRVEATDNDGSDAYSTVRYSIVSGNIGDVFRIDEATGQIFVKKALDYDTAPTDYTLIVSATDGVSGSAINTASVSIRLADVNDIVPTYTESGTDGAFTRATDGDGHDAATSTGYSITITDADTSNDFRFEFNNNRFEFQNQGSGVWALFLKAGAVVNLTPSPIRLTYRVYDGANYAEEDGSVDIAVVATTVRFTEGKGSQTVSVDENDASAAVATLMATSIDLAGSISYSITGGNAEGRFTIADASTGTITLTEALNHESASQYTLEITATHHPSGDTQTADVIVNVGDENDVTPEFAPLQLAAGAMRGITPLAGATTGIDTLTGTADGEYIAGDAGNDTITSGGGADHIIGGAGTDTITLSDAAGSAETIYYRFSSAGTGAWTSADGSDTIKNFRRGEDKIVFLDTDGTPIDLTTLTSAANIGNAGGGLEVKVITPGLYIDGFEIIFDGNNKLRVEYHTATRERIRIPEPGENDITNLDFEEVSKKYLGPWDDDGVPTSIYWNTYILKDNTLLPFYFGAGTHDNLQVIDDDDLLEILGAGIIIPETHTGIIATLAATDDDGTSPNNRVSYDITAGNADDLFAIDGSGRISVKAGATLDYDGGTTSYTLEITAADNGNNPLRTRQDVTIAISDVNDIVPTYTESGTPSVEATSTGHGTATSTGYSITIDDDDTGNDFTFGLSDSTRFEFRDQGNGVWALFLKANQIVTASSSPIALTYQLNDGVNDAGQSGSINVAVVDTSVRFTAGKGNQIVRIDEDAAPSTTIVARLEATSAESGGSISYNITDGNADRTFVIGTGTGTIALNKALDYESGTTQYTLTVTATHTPSGKTRTATVVVNVDDVNEHSPTFAPLALAEDPLVMIGRVKFGDTTAGANTIQGTTADEYIDGGAGVDTINSGGGSDYIVGGAGNDRITIGGGASHIFGGTGTDTITLSSTRGSVETIYYRFSSAGTGAWTGSDGIDLISNFVRGEDRLVLIDTDGTPINLDTFLHNNNLGDYDDDGGHSGAGGELSLRALRSGGRMTGVEIQFGSNQIQINYHTSTRDLTFSQGNYFPDTAKYLGAFDKDGNPTGIHWPTGLLKDNGLLRHYFGDGAHDNLQVIADDAILDELKINAYISESLTSADGAFATLAATDADGAAPNNTITYDITGGTGRGLFAIDANGGISVAPGATLDYEGATTTYTLTITASDNLDANGDADPSPDDTQTIIIALADANDIAPTYIESGANDAFVRATTTGNADATSTGYSITITDADTANDLTVTTNDNRFRFIRDGDVWHLVSLANQAIPASPSSIRLTYRVYDGINYAEEDGSVDIEVLTTTVRFSSGKGSQTVNADENDFQAVYVDLDASSIETGGTIIYAITDGNVGRNFSITSGGGEIVLNRALDYESGQTQYTLEITATHQPSGDIRTANVIVNVNDVNDHAPIFAPLQLAAGVVAGIPTIAGTTGTTADEYIQGTAGVDTITSGGGADHIFGGAGNDGITLSSARGSVETIYYRFSSVDGAWTGSDGVDTINNFRRGEDRIIFLDTDDSVISLTDFLSASNLGNSGGRLSVRANFTTTMNGVEIRFGSQKLVVNYHDDSRETIFNFGPGYLAAAHKYLGPRKSQTISTPTKFDINTRILTDHSLLPNYFNKDDTQDNLQIADDFSVILGADVFIPETHTGIIATLTATDADGTDANNQVSYDITGGNDDGKFTIDERGRISVALDATLDYETTSTYTLEITATDNGITPMPMATTRNITITLTDVNDVTPTYTFSGAASVRATGTGHNTATTTGYNIIIDDADITNVFTFGLNDNRFEFVNQGNGRWELFLKANQAVAASSTPIALTYSVHDGVNRAADSGAVSVAIVDTTVDFAPGKGSQTVSAREDTGTFGASIATLEATTTETGGSISYDITGGNGGGIFGVVNNGGGLFLRKSLDYETQTQYTLEITATHSPSGKARTATVVVNVQDVNEHTPIFAPLELTISPQVLAGHKEIKSTAGLIRGTTGDDYIQGGGNNDQVFGFGGNDIIFTGAGNDGITTHGDGASHLIGGTGNDTITLSQAAGHVDTIYYRFSAGTGAWVGSDGVDALTDFRRGEDRLILIDTDGTPLSLTDFLSNNNRGSAGGQLTVKAILHNGYITGVNIQFGSNFDSNKVAVYYHASNHVRFFDQGNYLPAAEKYFGAFDGNGNPTGIDVQTQILTDNSLLKHYFGDGVHDNLQITDESILTELKVDVRVAENFTSANGAFATLTANDADGIDADNQVSYDITGGTGMGIFDIDDNGGISVLDGVELDYESGITRYTLTIAATDNGTPAKTATKTIAIGIIDVNDIPIIYDEVLQVQRITKAADPQTTINNGAHNLFIGTTAGADNIWGGGAADVFYGREGHDKLRGGNGNDVFHAGKHTDVIWGGGGADIFVLDLENRQARNVDLDVVADFGHNINSGNFDRIRIYVDNPARIRSIDDIQSALGIVFEKGQRNLRGSLSESGSDRIARDEHNTLIQDNLYIKHVTSAVFLLELEDYYLNPNQVLNLDKFEILSTNEKPTAAVHHLEITEHRNEANPLAQKILTMQSLKGATVTIQGTHSDLFEVRGNGLGTFELFVKAGVELDHEIHSTIGLDIFFSEVKKVVGRDIASYDAQRVEITVIEHHVESGNALVKPTTAGGNSYVVDTGYSIAIDDDNIGDITITPSDNRFDFVKRQDSNIWDLVLLANQAITESVGDAITLTYSVDDTFNPAVESNPINVNVVDSFVYFTQSTDIQTINVLDGDFSRAGDELTSVKATSMGDGGIRITYAFEGGSLTSGLFSIDSKTGKITYTADTSFDIDEQPTHRLNVRAANLDGDTATAIITINVNNTPDASPAKTPNHQAVPHTPYDPEDDPLAGITPLPDTDPNG